MQGLYSRPKLTAETAERRRTAVIFFSAHLKILQ